MHLSLDLKKKEVLASSTGMIGRSIKKFICSVVVLDVVAEERSVICTEYQQEPEGVTVYD